MAIVNYYGQAGRSLSPGLWRGFPKQNEERIFGPRNAYFFYDDFLSGVSDATVTTAAYHAPYDLFAESGASFTGSTDVDGGAVQMVAGTTADANCIMNLGAGVLPFVISDGSSEDYLLCFEARIKISTIADDVSSFFVGLADARAADSIITTSQGSTIDSAWGNTDMIGYWRGDDDGDGLNFGYGATGQTAQQVLADAHTLVADTFVKVGFRYDPKAIAAERISLWVNGSKKSTYVTATNIAAATFPDDEEMTMVAAIMNDDGSTASTLSIDWWACGQVSA